MRTLLSTSRCKPSSPPGSPRLGLGVPPDQEAERRTARPTRIKEDEDGGGRGGWSSSCQQQRHHGQSRRRRGRWTDRWQVAPPRYAYWPLLSCTHWASPLTPSLTLTPPSYLVIIYLQGAKKWRDAETPAELQNVQNLLLSPPSLLFHIFKSTEYDAKTNDQIENGVGEMLMTVNP